ncbi:MAG: hypothetical protein P1V51_24525 [Deltaproteobacteria bacterium]|nr:hypothetical protein [Deltaproteobacteria bacterium]
MNNAWHVLHLLTARGHLEEMTAVTRAIRETGMDRSELELAMESLERGALIGRAGTRVLLTDRGRDALRAGPEIIEKAPTLWGEKLAAEVETIVTTRHLTLALESVRRVRARGSLPLHIEADLLQRLQDFLDELLEVTA